LTFPEAMQLLGPWIKRLQELAVDRNRRGLLMQARRDPRLAELLSYLQRTEDTLRILKESGADFSGGIEVLRRHLMARASRLPETWRLRAIVNQDREALAPWLGIKGQEHLEAAREGGRGVILLSSHFGVGLAAPLWLAREGNRVFSIHRERAFERLRVTPPEALTVRTLDESFWAKLLFEAQRFVRKGGIAHLAGDGLAGDSGLTVNFRGRERRFKGGFAGLALEAKVEVVPVFVPVAASGQLSIEFEPKLEPGSPDSPKNERYEALISDYVGRLERRWNTDPGNVQDRHVLRFDELPPFEPANRG
jgi:lauroyl/myristoyl acyltransferase